MSNDGTSEKLVTVNYITLLLRLLVNQQGRIVHGEVVDLNGQIIGRFATLSDLVHILSSMHY